MAKGYLERWPFRTDARPSTEGSYDPDTDGATHVFVTAAGDALGTDPLALPALNGRVDAGCVDSLMAEPPTDPPEGVRVAVEVTFGEASVVLCDDGRVEVYTDDRRPNDLEPVVTADHDWSTAESLLWSIGEAVSMASDEDPVDITTRLIERLDSDAVDCLLRPLADGSDRRGGRLLLSVDGYEVTVDPGGSITAEPSLAVLRRSGAALLVVGSIPEQGFDRASATLLGEPDPDRSPVFVLHGRDLDTARRRLSMAGMSPSAGTVLDHRATARAASAEASEANHPADRDSNVVPVSGGVRVLPEAIREAIGDATPASPGELRICVDSLGSMIESADLETTRGVIDAICRTVRERHGIGHFMLPGDPDREEVERLAPSFDAIVELRTGDAGTEQRWRLTGTGHETSWFPVE